MQNPKLTTSQTAAAATPKPGHGGIHLVGMNRRAGDAAARIALAEAQPSEPQEIADAAETRSGEIFRMKLAACIGAAFTAPIVWCLHSAVLALHKH